MNIRGWVVGVLAAALLPLSRSGAEEIETAQLPSAEEIYEALAEGDISYEQYEMLMELMESGMTADVRYLLDELPNLTDLLTSGEADSAQTSSDGPHSTLPQKKRTIARRISHQYYSTFDDPGQSRYATSVRYDFNREWSAAVQLRKDLSGRERFVSRSVAFRPDSGWVEELAAGSFRARYGLGTAIGFHAKTLRYASRLNSESFLCPDNSAFNGAKVALHRGRYRAEGMVSVNRDSAHALTTFASTLERHTNRRSLAFILAASRISDRTTGGSLSDIKTALSFSRREESGSTTIEYCAQFGHQTDFGTIVMEGDYYSTATSVRYSVWRYGTRFMDITSGAVAATIRHTTCYPEVELEHSDKRPGQFGGQIRLASRLSSTITGSLYGLAAWRNEDSSLVQFRPGLTWSPGPHWNWTLDYLYCAKSRYDDSDLVTPCDRKIRFDCRFRSGGFAGHGYLAQVSSATRGDYLALFGSLKHSIGNGGSIELWTNLGRLARGRIEYWYGYFRVAEPLTTNLKFAFKIGHRVDQTATRCHQTSALFEVAAML